VKRYYIVIILRKFFARILIFIVPRNRPDNIHSKEFIY